MTEGERRQIRQDFIRQLTNAYALVEHSISIDLVVKGMRTMAEYTAWTREEWMTYIAEEQQFQSDCIRKCDERIGSLEEKLTLNRKLRDLNTGNTELHRRLTEMERLILNDLLYLSDKKERHLKELQELNPDKIETIKSSRLATTMSHLSYWTKDLTTTLIEHERVYRAVQEARKVYEEWVRADPSLKLTIDDDAPWWLTKNQTRPEEIL